MTKKPLSIDELTIEQLLAIPEGEPERLFQPDAAAIKTSYRKLAQKFHPDKNPDARAADAFLHAQKLQDRANYKLENGIWETPGLLQLMQKSGRTATIRYLKKHPFELGEMYICDGKVVFVVKPDFEDLFNNGVKVAKNLKFDNDKMREQFTPQLPHVEGTFQTADNRHVLVAKRDNDLILMQDLIDHAGGKIEPVHVAWIMSRLHNLNCYLQWAGIAHNDISPHTVFVRPKDTISPPVAGSNIAPKDHTIALLGGWWYAVKDGAQYVGLPARTLSSIPRTDLTKPDPRASTRTDQALVRLAGREMLGDPSGIRLATDGTIKKYLSDWLTLPGSGDAIKDYQTWQGTILPEAFGKRRFTEWDVKPSSIYPQP